MPTQVRKILNQQGLFICGMCRSTSRDRGAVIGCFQKCVAGLLKSPCMLEDTKRSRFICLLCDRSYREKSDAETCVKHCVSEIKAYQQSLKNKLEAVGSRYRKGFASAASIGKGQVDSRKIVTSFEAYATESSENKVEELKMATSRQKDSDPNDELNEFGDSLELGVAGKAG